MRTVGGIQLPDSAICRAAATYAESYSEPFLFHHVMRSFVFADLIGRKRSLAYDREVLFCAAILHDLGLTRMAPVKQRFEIEGADAAKELLAREGMKERDVELVWDAIALHTTAEVPQRKAPEIALCQLGIATDIRMLQPDLIARDLMDEVQHSYPRLDINRALIAALVRLYKVNPAAAASHPVAEACERNVDGFRRRNICDVLSD